MLLSYCDALKKISLLSMILISAQVYAGQFEVSPIRVYMDQTKQKSTSMTIKNTASEPVQVQVKTFLWENSLLDSTMSPSNELVVSPPIVMIPPNQSQVLRLFWRGMANLKAERAYRLSITEVPSNKLAFKNAVSTYLSFSVPVFVRPNVSAAPVLAWRIQPPSSVLSDEANKVERKNISQLVLENTGDAHALLGTIQVEQEGAWVNFQKGPNYVLAKQKRSWVLPSSVKADQALKLRIQNETGQSQEVIVSQPRLP